MLELARPNSRKRSSSPDASDRVENPPTLPYTAFPPARKNMMLAIVTWMAFLGPLSGNIYLPLLPVLARELRVSATLINLTVTVFMLVFAVAVLLSCSPFCRTSYRTEEVICTNFCNTPRKPLLFASLSDARGRKPWLTIGLLIFIGANIAMALAPALYATFVILRIIQAFGASALYSLGAGTIADIFEPKQRARAISFFSLGPQLGPILGPVIGGAMAQQASWRWTFGFLGINWYCLMLF